MQLEDEKVAENRKLRRLENQKVGGSKTCQPSCTSPSYFLVFKIFVFIRVHPLPAIALAQARRAGWFSLSLVTSFLFPISGYPVYEKHR